MARIPEAEIERIKQEVSVQRLAEARGIQLARHGADLIGLCPFHEDHEPSLVITPSKNLWHCPGSLPDRRICNRLGDEDKRRELPACGRTPACGSSLFSCVRADRAESDHRGGEA